MIAKVELQPVMVYVPTISADLCFGNEEFSFMMKQAFLAGCRAYNISLPDDDSSDRKVWLEVQAHFVDWVERWNKSNILKKDRLLPQDLSERLRDLQKSD